MSFILVLEHCLFLHHFFNENISKQIHKAKNRSKDRSTEWWGPQTVSLKMASKLQRPPLSERRTEKPKTTLKPTNRPVWDTNWDQKTSQTGLFFSRFWFRFIDFGTAEPKTCKYNHANVPFSSVSLTVKRACEKGLVDKIESYYMIAFTHIISNNSWQSRRLQKNIFGYFNFVTKDKIYESHLCRSL